MKTFYLGTHETSWLRRTWVPLFVSHRRLRRLVNLYPATCDSWACDSGGFSELDGGGRWSTTAREYAAALQRYDQEIGRMAWAAPQDWMCEPRILAQTGLTVAGHQDRTVASVLELRAMVPTVHIIPVLQGWELADYHRCVELYDRVGIDLRAEPAVGLGSVCRRQATREIGTIAGSLARLGLRLHGFGVKARGLALYSRDLISADSMAWSLDARRSPALPGHRHQNCANCMVWAGDWRERVLRAIRAGQVKQAA